MGVHIVVINQETDIEKSLGRKKSDYTYSSTEQLMQSVLKKAFEQKEELLVKK